MVICLERGADLRMSQLMPVPLTVSCSSKIQIGFTSLVPAHLGSPGKRAVKRVCVCVCVCVYDTVSEYSAKLRVESVNRPTYRRDGLDVPVSGASRRRVTFANCRQRVVVVDKFRRVLHLPTCMPLDVATRIWFWFGLSRV